MAGDLRIYSVKLDADTASELAGQLVPELKRLKPDLTDCVLKVALQNNELAQIELDCSGSIKVVSRNVDSSVKVAVRYTGEHKEISIPAAVKTALLG